MSAFNTRWFSRSKAKKTAANGGAPAIETRAATALGLLGRAARWRFPGAATAPWLLLAWDIGGLDAAIVGAKAGAPLASASSRQADFAAALAEVIEQFDALGQRCPKRVALAARHFRALTAALPVNPDKPRPPAQMRELLRGDLESALAEFGSLWTTGALLQARGHLSASDRERVVLEETLRRQDRRTPLRYGETALELALIDRASLNECLELEERLQHADPTWLAAWLGWVDDGHPHWLAGALSGRRHRQCGDALARHGLRLAATLPIGWLCSEPAAPDEGVLISIELHDEEVLAILRRQGRIVAARSDGRMERALQSDWLTRLIDDWVDEVHVRIEVVCRKADDEQAAARLAADLELTSGHPATLIAAAAARAALWTALAREARAEPTAQRLPRLLASELRVVPWKNPDLLRVAALAAIIALLLVSEGVQHYQLRRLRGEIAERSKKESERQKLVQFEMKVNSETRQVGKELETLRGELEPLINTRTRLEAIAIMRRHLPDLMQMLAQAIGDDAVLEKVGNSKSGSDAASIRVEAWSSSYTGAQAFVNRVAEQTQRLDYGVAQTEIGEERGRNNKMGYRVGFWLLPEPDDLEQAAAATRPAPAGGQR